MLNCNQSDTDASWLNYGSLAEQFTSSKVSDAPILLYQLAADPGMGVVKRAGVITGRRLAAATANIVRLLHISRRRPALKSTTGYSCAHVVMT